MKKKLLYTISLLFCILFIGACTSGPSSLSGDAKYSIVCSFFPEYEWVKELIKGNEKDYEITMLLDNGIDIHSYQPSTGDIVKISSADLFIYVGGESDSWATDALAEAVNKNMHVVNLMETVGDSVREEEIMEGMEGSEDTSEDESEEEPEYDEHVWLSLINTKKIVSSIKEALCDIDAANSGIYNSNAEEYNKKLDELDSEYKEVFKTEKKHTLLFGDRFPFRYMFDDYGIEYYAAFPGCSAETEASFKTVTYLAGKVEELGLSSVLVTETSDKKMAQTIIDNTESKDQDILVLDSMQSKTLQDIEKGTTYLGIMQENLNILKKAIQ